MGIRKLFGQSRDREEVGSNDLTVVGDEQARELVTCKHECLIYIHLWKM